MQKTMEELSDWAEHKMCLGLGSHKLGENKQECILNFLENHVFLY